MNGPKEKGAERPNPTPNLVKILGHESQKNAQKARG